MVFIFLQNMNILQLQLTDVERIEILDVDLQLVLLKMLFFSDIEHLIERAQRAECLFD